MGKISFARVDQRLIHGQVVVTVAGSTDADVIYVVDNELATDEFMQTILKGSAKKANMKFKAYSVEQVIKEWKENQFGKDHVLLLSKSVDTMLEVIEGGVEMPFLNIGNHTKPKDGISIIGTAGINEKQLNGLIKAQKEKSIDIYFQTIPGGPGKTSLDDASRKFK